MTVCILLSAVVTLTGCGDKELPAYSDFVDIDPGGWYPGVAAELSPLPADSTEIGLPFSLELAVRHTGAAPDTLRLVVTTESFSTPLRNDTLTLLTRNALSAPAGKGSFGIYTVTHPLSAKTVQPEGLRIAVEPVSRTPGILSVGLLLKR